MDDHGNHSLHATLNAKLAEIVETSPVPPTWFEAWSKLGPTPAKKNV